MKSKSKNKSKETGSNAKDYGLGTFKQERLKNKGFSEWKRYCGSFGQRAACIWEPEPVAIISIDGEIGGIEIAHRYSELKLAYNGNKTAEAVLNFQEKTIEYYIKNNTNNTRRMIQSTKLADNMIYVFVVDLNACDCEGEDCGFSYKIGVDCNES